MTGSDVHNTLSTSWSSVDFSSHGGDSRSVCRPAEDLTESIKHVDVCGSDQAGSKSTPNVLFLLYVKCITTLLCIVSTLSVRFCRGARGNRPYSQDVNQIFGTRPNKHNIIFLTSSFSVAWFYVLSENGAKITIYSEMSLLLYHSDTQTCLHIKYEFALCNTMKKTTVGGTISGRTPAVSKHYTTFIGRLKWTPLD